MYNNTPLDGILDHMGVYKAQSNTSKTISIIQTHVYTMHAPCSRINMLIRVYTYHILSIVKEHVCFVFLSIYT